MRAVYWKELADYFGSRRFAVLLLLIAVAAVWAGYTASQGIREEASRPPTEFIFLRLFNTSRGVTPTFLFFVSFFGPLLGLALGFDAVNSERSRGTLSRVLAQPIYRDALITGKFFAGVTVLAVVLFALMVVVVGIGIYTLGFSPTFDEVVRIAFFLGTTIVYVAVWLALAILFSLLFDRAVVSSLASLGVWLLLTFFIFFFAGTIADLAVSDVGDANQLAERVKWEQRIQRFSPAFLYEESNQALLNPRLRTLGPISQEQAQAIIPNPLPLRQSLNLVWPQLTGLLAMLSVVFAIGYIKFLRDEIRA